MLTVLESINLSAEYLNKKGIDSPKLNAELLLACILNCKRLDLYLSFDRPLKEDEIQNYRELLKRRASNEPLQYILGSVEFYGLEFKVNSSVLIPRQETEILVETIINTADKEKEYNVLDIGTGSGIIAVSLAKHLPAVKITALDISEKVLTVAALNAELNEVKDRINFIQADITKDNCFEDKFDIIVSNPPYISSAEYEELKPELKVYEPKFALTDYNDGLSFYRSITGSAGKMLNPGKSVYFELGAGQSASVKAIMEQNGFSKIEIIKDYLGIDRVISGEINC
jgi:release factor glutamine methyltransferase